MILGKQNKLFIVNVASLISGLLASVSGLVILINYHMGHEGVIISTDMFWRLDYFDWALLHKISVVVFTLFIMYHVVLHWKWYKTIIRKKLVRKNLQVVILSILFLLAAITGFIPWFIQMAEGGEHLRKVFMEIHDKLGLILFIYLILHLIKRAKWFVNMGNR
jgi:hypothetical protein